MASFLDTPAGPRQLFQMPCPPTFKAPFCCFSIQLWLLWVRPAWIALCRAGRQQARPSCPLDQLRAMQARLGLPVSPQYSHSPFPSLGLAIPWRAWGSTGGRERISWSPRSPPPCRPPHPQACWGHTGESETPDHSQATEVTAAIASPSGGRGCCAAACLGGGRFLSPRRRWKTELPPSPQRFCMCKARGACGLTATETGLGTAGVRRRVPAPGSSSDRSLS